MTEGLCKAFFGSTCHGNKYRHKKTPGKNERNDENSKINRKSLPSSIDFCNNKTTELGLGFVSKY